MRNFATGLIKIDRKVLKLRTISFMLLTEKVRNPAMSQASSMRLEVGPKVG